MTYNKKVIVLSVSGGPWRLFDYVSPGGNNLIEEWLRNESDDTQLAFQALLKNIGKTEKHTEWAGWRGFLRGKPGREGIWELGFKSDGRQYRVFGCFWRERKEATLLVGCYHKGKVYHPADALDSSIKRIRKLRSGEAIRNERKIRTDF